MKSYRAIQYAVVTAGAIAIMAGAGCRAPAPRRAVRIGVQDNAFSALLLAARGAGLFEANGLDVAIAKYPSGKVALNAAFDDAVDLCTVADMPVTANSFKRDDFRVLCSIGYTDNGAWIVARRDRGIAKPADLVGKTIGTQEGSAVHFFLASFLVHNRIPANQVKVVFMPAVDLPAALIDGTIDAFSMRNPFNKQAVEALGDNAIELFEPHAYRMFFTLVIRKDVLERDPSIARDVIAALVQAEALVRKDRDRAVRLVAAELGPDRMAEVEGDWDAYTFEVALGQDLIRCFEDQARWAIEQGRAETKEPPDFRCLIAPAAIKAARPESFTVIE